ncbi:helix-turn-helix domain-containing protein [Bradyrhizobium zhanjiangense]|uniref:helix-turn-helix domain-containing protein n=1 Tax=Bradyrhizobium zhanjiangense TaxID=1325107 RepID=UPI0010092803|nr:helix-turn-helix domain-containing protein [Bradyrhizobium zhanjiangense]
MKPSVVTIEPNGHFCSDCAVRASAVCSSLDAAELREFEHLGRRVHFASGETVFSEEDITTSFYNVIEGVMRLYKLLPDGRRQIVGFALPGDFLGMNISGRHNFSADAIGAVTVCQFAKATFGRFIESRPQLLRRINELAIRELSHARDHMVLLGRRSADEKVATFLLGWRQRLLALGGSLDTVPLPMSRQDIADYLGLTIETVSRTFTKLVRHGAIEILHGGISLRDPARVEALAAA